MQRLLSFWVALFLAAIVHAYDFQAGDLYYRIISKSDKTVEVTYQERYSPDNYKGLTSATIPASVTNNDATYSVTSIGELAFYDCIGLTSIAIPNSVTSIGYSAFSSCTSLTSITISNSVTSIGNSAFSGCTGLTSITIPNGVTSIGSEAFRDCKNLTSISIPNSVTDIGIETFVDCIGLTSVSIGNGVTSIGISAFVGCTGLTSITIGNSVTSIDAFAFSGCTSLTSITIPNSVTSIGDIVFRGCTGLTAVTIGNSVTSIGNRAFYGCTSLTSITIPNRVKVIGRGTFQGCTSLTSVVIGDNKELNIETDAFADCDNLISVTCYANVPPIIVFDESNKDDEGNELETPIVYGAFEANRLSEMQLYVPAKAISQYQVAEEWKDFGRIVPIGATTVETDDEQPIVQPTFTDVTITWKITPNADTYTILIAQDGTEVCTLVFNADGQLTNIAFPAPSRGGEQRNRLAAVLTQTGYRFTVTGLSSGTRYAYALTVKDGSESVLQSYSGSFTTKGENITTDLDNVDGSDPNGNSLHGDNLPSNNTPRKVFRDGQIYILRDGKTYTLTGVEVK